MTSYLFIIVPAALTLFSFAGVIFVVSRKFSYSRKLTPESHEFGPTIFHDYFPEIMSTLGKIKLDEYLSLTMRELEKLLRRIRLVFSKIDAVSNSLISELRAVNLRNKAAQEEAAVPAIPEPPVPLDSHIEIRPKRSDDGVALKNQEQQLIVEIAHHPKDAKLYATLGEVYIQMKNFPDAKEALEAASELDNQNQALRDRLAFVTRKLKESGIEF